MTSEAQSKCCIGENENFDRWKALFQIAKGSLNSGYTQIADDRHLRPRKMTVAHI